MKNTLFTLFILLLAKQIIAQNIECGFDKLHRYHLDSTPAGAWDEQQFNDGLQQFRQSYTYPSYGGGVQNRGNSCLGRKFLIPVIVHIIHAPGDSVVGTGSNITNQQVLDQMDILNNAIGRAFSGNHTAAGEPDMYFCIPEFGGNKAIYRYASSNTDIPVNGINILDSIKGNFPNNKNYIHIYIVNSITGSGSGLIAGFGVHPTVENTWRPGIMLARKFCGDATANNNYTLDSRSRGLALVHEMGHFLGLFHTFYGACAGMDTTKCATDGDKCCDTPPVEAANTTCTPNNSCHESPIDKNDLIQNHMDYTPDDCRILFTPDQISIMHYTLLNYRSALINPEFLSTIKLPCSINSPWFMADVTEICDSGEVTFTGIFRTGVPSPQFYWKIFKNSTLVKSQYSGSNTFKVNLTSTGLYTVQLKIKPNDCDTITLQRNNVVEVKNCGPILHDPNAVWNFGERLSLEFHINGMIATQNARKVSPPPGIKTSQTAISVSDTNGVLRFYGGNDDGDGRFIKPPGLNKRVKLWYRDTASDFDFITPRSANEYIKGTGNAFQNLVVNRPGFPKEYWWVTLYNGAVNGQLYYRKIALNNANNYDISGPANIALKGPVGFPADSGAVFSGEALTAVASANDSFYWMFFFCPSKTGSAFDSTLVIYKILQDTITYFNSVKINEPGYGVIKVSPDGRWVYTNSNLYEFNRKTGTIALKHSFYDYVDKRRNAMTAAEFSQNSRFLYIARSNYLNTRPAVDSVFQLDLDRSDPYAYRRTISITPRAFLFLFQRTPDSRIAMIRSNYVNMMDMINAPDRLCTTTNSNNCEFTFNAFNPTIPGRTDMNVNISMPDPVIDLITRTEKRISYYVDSCFQYHFTHNTPWATGSIWHFGDGNQATGREVRHTYNPGNYVALCIIGSDTLRRNISVKQKTFSISGKTATCDSNQFAFYNVNVGNSELKYNWGVSGGSNANSSSLDQAYIKWYNIGFVNVELADNSDGCVYNDTLFTTPQTPISNNTISGDTLFCDNFLNVIGSNPSGGNSGYTYSWFVKRNGIQFTLDSFTKSLTYPTQHLPYSNSLLYRNVVSNGCVDISNPLRLITRESANNIVAIPNGCAENLTDFDTANRIAGSTYQWQYSIDSLSWQSISGQNAGSYMVSGKSWPKRFFRRILNLPGCGYDTSNIIKIEGFIYIANQPVDAAGCNNMTFQLFADVVDNRKIASTFRWQYLNGLDWTNLSVNIGGAPLLIDTASKYPHGISFRLKIENACFSIFSNSVILKKTVNPTIISTDHSHNANSNSSLKLKGQWAGERNVCYAVWQRSTNPIGAVWDSIGKTTEDSFEITIPEFTKCQQRWYYRLALRNLCPPTGKKYWDNEVASSAIEVGAYQISTYLQDLWVPDSKADNGTEPNLIDTQNYTHSHRLWNRNWADKYQLVDDWTDRVDLQTDRDTNFIHLMVYNRGDSSVSQGDIYFYWTVMSVNEDWPYSWTGAAEFKNLDHPNGSNGSNKFNNASGYKTYPLGGRINKSAIELNSFLNQTPAITLHPAYNNKLKPGDSILITYPWVQADTVPQPGWYYGVVDNQHMYSNHIGLCLLARIQECESPNYGMTYPEKIHYGNQSNGSLTYKGNIGYNILMNNNIVSSNFYLGYMDPPFIGTPQVWTLGSVKRPDTGIVGTRDLKFNFCVNDPIFYNHGEVVITPTDDFWNEFQTLSYPGSGFSINAADHQIIVHDPCAAIGPIQVPDTFSTMLGFTWRYLPNSNHSGSLLNSLFTLKEYNESELIGITQYGVKSHLNSNGGNNGGGQGAPMPQIKDSTRSKSSNNNYKLQVHPNPFDNLIEITYEGEPEGSVRFWILDAQGRVVSDLGSYSLNENGNLKLLQNNLNSHPGLYYLKAVENNIHATVKMIKVE